MITYKQHTVQRGEDFSVLARNYLGDPRLWNVIAKANPQYPIRYVNGVPYVTLHVGDVVRVPVNQPDPAPAPNPAPAWQEETVVEQEDVVISPPTRPNPAPTPPSEPPSEDESSSSSSTSDGGWMKWLLLGGLALVALGKKKRGSR